MHMLKFAFVKNSHSRLSQVLSARYVLTTTVFLKDHFVLAFILLSISRCLKTGGKINQDKNSAREENLIQILFWVKPKNGLTTVAIFLKATRGKPQNRISLKQQRFLKNDKSEKFRFLSSLQISLFEG